ncbi:MAG: 2-oxoacid:ferredoxin oxidoreductase subunit beta [candidate division NC10 bacterium]|nr:2-oxoacid:ferredoxin oxidoreductase subunit beta [candidate division NC10 bacterium]
MSLYERYLRLPMMPNIWCSGCGNGIVLKALLRAIDRLELDKDEVCMVSGIGCSSRLPGYVDFNTLHTTHGRALAFATGIKLAKPDLTVIVISGDGDALAIGGNHFIHAARRNIDLTLILFNNLIYGMTGGQYSPTTPPERYATTAPYGHIEAPFDISELAQAAGATYVARGTAYHAAQLDKLIEGGIRNRGFSLIEVLVQCPTIYGRRNRLGDALAMLKWQRDVAVSRKAAEKLSPEELAGKVITGLLFSRERPEYCQEYEKLIARAQGREGVPS